MSERLPIETQAESHLKQALEADSSEEKNFHIRSALQFIEYIDNTERTTVAPDTDECPECGSDEIERYQIE